MPPREISVGRLAPAFSLPADDGTTVRLANFAGSPVVLFFYPKDSTSGCTRQACDFRDHYAVLRRQGAALLGVSRDGAASHAKFRAAHGLPFPLLVDADAAVAAAYGAWKEKAMYGRKYMGIERTTVLIAADGKVAEIWRKVRVPGHAEAVVLACR